MKCSSCGAEVDPNSKFCAGCGTPVSASHFCAQCGSEVGANVAFCPGCGASQSPGGTGAPYAAPPQYQAPAQYPPTYDARPTFVMTDQIKYKGVIARFFSTLIDYIILGTFFGIMVNQYGTRSETGFSLEGMPALVTFLVVLFYYLPFEAYFKGTIGKLVLGQRIVNSQGRAPGLGKAIVRNILRIIDSLPLLYIIGAILVASSDRKQRLGDRAAGTFVVSSWSAKAMRNASRG